MPILLCNMGFCSSTALHYDPKKSLLILPVQYTPLTHVLLTAFHYFTFDHPFCMLTISPIHFAYPYLYMLQYCFFLRDRVVHNISRHNFNGMKKKLIATNKSPESKYDNGEVGNDNLQDAEHEELETDPEHNKLWVDLSNLDDFPKLTSKSHKITKWYCMTGLK